MKEIELKIRHYPDKILREKARWVKELTPQHRQILEKMAQIMYESKGIGLAAPQVGISERMIVADIGDKLYKLINPKVIFSSGSQINEEGCLSVPGFSVKVKRPAKIKLQAQDENGCFLEMDASGLLACVFLHEIDHLNGKLIVDYASFLERIKIKRALKNLDAK